MGVQRPEKSGSVCTGAPETRASHAPSQLNGLRAVDATPESERGTAESEPWGFNWSKAELEQGRRVMSSIVASSTVAVWNVRPTLYFVADPFR